MALLKTPERVLLRHSVRKLSTYVSVPFFQIDSFASSPLGGNPAAVLLLPSVEELPLSDDTLKRIAAENNLSETAFVRPGSCSSSFSLRWFTPTKEVALCGHGTLAAAAALLVRDSASAPDRCFSFDTLSGTLTAQRLSGEQYESLSGVENIALDFPANPPILLPLHGGNESECRIRGLAEAVLRESCCTLAQIKALAYNATTKKLLVHMESEPGGDPKEIGDGGGNSQDAAAVARAAIESMQVPAPERLLEVHDGSLVTGVSVVAAGSRSACGGTTSENSRHGDEECCHFVSRYFAPWNGIPEDPVNGSSHTLLAPYWAEHVTLNQDGPGGGGGSRAGEEAGSKRFAFVARQASPRGGDLALTYMPGDNSDGRVGISGPAAVVIRGEMLVPRG